MSRHQLLLGASAIGIIVAVLPLGNRAARGEPPSYTAIANAESARVTYTIPGAPLTEAPVDGGGTRSQASSGGIDGSRGYAAAPDPGEAVVTLPSLLRGLAGVDLPSYPLAATSQNPLQPDQTADIPGVHLHAASSEQHSDAETVVGAADGQVQTTATAGVVDDVVSAQAEAIVGDITAGPLRISGLRSSASLVRHPDGTIERHSDLTMASASVAGVPISVGADGITLAGTAIPVPGAASLRDLLLGAGVEIHVLASQSTDTTVTSPVLMITTPSASLVGQPGTATYMIGRATALLDVITPPAAPAPRAATSPTDRIVSGPSAAPVIAPPVGALPAANPATTPTPSATTPRPIASTAGGAPVEWQLRNIYLAFVLAALALTAGNAALRHLGVRT